MMKCCYIPGYITKFVREVADDNDIDKREGILYTLLYMLSNYAIRDNAISMNERAIIENWFGLTNIGESHYPYTVINHVIDEIAYFIDKHRDELEEDLSNVIYDMGNPQVSCPMSIHLEGDILIHEFTS